MGNIFVKAATVLATAITVSVPALAIEQGNPGGKAVTRAAFQQTVSARFAAIDANHDGTISRAEHDAHRAAKTGGRRGARFAALDADKDGRITREEFLARAPKGRGMATLGLGRLGSFAAMDANRDGHVTLAEATARPLAAFDAADTNRDGQVTPEERRAARIGADARRG